MTQTSPRSKGKITGLGCDSPVAGWGTKNERAAQKFDRAVHETDAKIPSAPQTTKKTSITSAPKRKRLNIAAE